jgi:hypothetical protein
LPFMPLLSRILVNCALHSFSFDSCLIELYKIYWYNFVALNNDLFFVLTEIGILYVDRGWRRA